MRPIEAIATEAGATQVPSRLVDDWVLREQFRIALSFFAMLLTAGLAWLVIHREPLPVGDFGSSALATVVFCLVTIGLVLYVRRLPLLSFPVLFLVVTFLFTCSSLVLYQTEGGLAFRSWQLVDTEAILLAMPVVMLAFSSFLVGALLLPTRVPDRVPDPVSPRADALADARILRKVGFGVYAISILFITAFTLTGSALTLAFEGGYGGFKGAARAGGLSQFVTSSMTQLLPWSLLILTATCRDRRSRIVVVLLSLPAIGVMLASGDRSTAIPTMVLIAAGLYLLGSRIGWRGSLVIAALVVFLIPTILNLRTVPISAWSGSVIAKAATNQMQQTSTYGEDFLGSFLVSMSTSYQTLMATVKAVPEQQAYRYGVDYVGSLVVAVPFHSLLLPLLGADIERFQPSQWVLSLLHP
ncbi:MAG: O-antigen polysaccharide polymerase Wzy, partial [Actinomycetota bacterium]|nr:O-antigen polysaccharide polymerase Wzy [Actinomycetota bacterium]